MRGKMASASEMRAQINEQRRKVDFDSYDLSVDELLRRIKRGTIDVAPVYQRQFRWDVARQSQLIESLLLGIPVPNLFMATNNEPDAPIRWEIVDGLQRSLTLLNFVGDGDIRHDFGLGPEPMVLSGLTKLSCLNGLSFVDLPEDIGTLLLDRSLKAIVLNDKSDKQVRFDLFERLNTGGIVLTDQEVRECVYRGEFIDLLRKLSRMDTFENVVLLTKTQKSDGTAEEFVLRFFAFLYGYKNFDHSVKDFLNDYTKMASEGAFDLGQLEIEFTRVFQFLAERFPEGIKRGQNKTPVNMYEGISVGAALALRTNGNLDFDAPLDWINSPSFIDSSRGATNTKSRVSARIELARDGFLGK